MASRDPSRSRALSPTAAEAETLLARYPDISEEELESLIRKFQHLPLLDFGLLAADERLGRKLDEFYHDHGDKLRPPLWGISLTMAILSATAIVLLAWAVS